MFCESQPAASIAIQAIEDHPLPTWVVDAMNFTIRSSNKAARTLQQVVGLQGSTLLQFFPEKHRLMLAEKLYQGSAAGVYQLLTHNDSSTFMELYGNKMEQENLLQVSMVDVTVRMGQQAALEEESRRYKAYIHNSAAGIYCQELLEPVPVNLPVDKLVEHLKSFTFLSECNPAFAAMYGFENIRSVIGMLPEQLLDLTDPNNVSYLRDFVLNGFVVKDAESHEKDCFGRPKYFLNNAIGIIENGMLTRIWGSQIDITERKKTEEREKLLASLVEETNDILTSADLHYRPTSWNKAAEKIYGLKAEEVIGKDLRDFLSMEYKGATREEVREAVIARGEWRGEAYFIRPSDGKRITLLGCFKLLRDRNGNPQQIVISGTDITIRTEADARLKESETRFRDMADSAPVMIWVSNEKGKVTYLNQAWIEFTGNDISGGHTQTWLEMLHPQDRTRCMDTWGDAYNYLKEISLVYRLRTACGNYRWVKDVSKPRFLSDGSFMGYIGSVVDVHDQKSTEEQLMYQATVLNNVSDIVITTDCDFIVKGWNVAAELYHGITAEEAIGKNLSDLIKFHFADTTLERSIEKLQDHGIWHGEVSFTNRDGATYYFLHTSKCMFDSLGNKIGYLGIGRDITERKMMEQKLLKSEQFYRTLIADSLYGTLLMNADGWISFCSPSITQILGYDTHEVEGKNAFSFIHPEDLITAADSFRNEITESPEVKFISVRVKRKDGVWNWCMLRAQNLLKNQYIESMVVYLHDDTQRKEASDALKESERRFRELIRDLRLGVVLQNADSQIILCNQAACQLLGLTEDQLLGKTSLDPEWNVVHEDGTGFPGSEHPAHKAILTRKPVRDVVMGVFNPQKKERVWILVNAEPIFTGSGEFMHVICSFTDITERKKLEQTLIADQILHQKQLTQASIDGQEKERREIGRELHDNIGQQLTTIKLFLEIGLEGIDDAAKEMLNLAMKGVKDVINDVRGMSRSLIPHTLKDLGLTESITELVEASILTQRIDISFDHSGLCTGKLPDNQKLTIYRIVQEQLNNIAKHAAATEVQIILRSTATTVELVIGDNGKGFDLNRVKRGLGITNIKNRVELFNGKAIVDTAPGKGTLLRVSMPIREEQVN